MYTYEHFERELLRMEGNCVLRMGLFTVRININVFKSHLKYIHKGHRWKGGRSQDPPFCSS